MTDFEVYQEYVALKAHFTTSSYDYIKHNGKVRVNQNSLHKRSDKFFFHKLTKHKDPKGFLLSNLIYNERFYIGECSFNEASSRIYTDWKKRTESLSYIFRQDLKKLDEDFDVNFRIEDGHPIVMKKFLQGDITLETLVILVDLVRCISYWDRELSDPVWRSLKRKVIKYKPFLNYDRAKMKKLVLAEYK